MLSTWRTAAVNTSGGQPILNAFLIDGAANDKIGDAAGAFSYLTVDASQEFKVGRIRPNWRRRHQHHQQVRNQ